MADIRKFSGYQAIDGSYHANKALAILATNEIKIRQELEKLFSDLGLTTAMVDIVYNNRASIVRALSVSAVLKSAPRRKRSKAEIPARISPDVPKTAAVEAL